MNIDPPQDNTKHDEPLPADFPADAGDLISVDANGAKRREPPGPGIFDCP
jgi:hypothetical protein